MNYEEATWIFAGLLAVILLLLYEGTPVTSQPILIGAASFVTIPLSLLNATASTSAGVLLLPIGFVLFVYYFKFLDDWLGDSVLAFILLAAALLIFVH